MTLTTRQIESIIKKDKCAKKVFGGVLPCNLLPRSMAVGPKFFIVNLDEHWKSGSHWVVVAVRSATSIPEYFDSYGIPPTKQDIIMFLERNSVGKGWTYNKIKYQGNLSTVCGYYCILYSMMIAKGFGLRDFHKLFSNKKEILNDSNVKKYLKLINNMKCK
jgi:hypothetical protein